MARATDQAGIQFRTLNASKGPAVRATRAQADRVLYRQAIRGMLESQPSLRIFQQEVADLELSSDRVTGVVTQAGIRFGARAVVLTVGTFLAGRIHIGMQSSPGGRAGDPPSNRLAARLRELPFRVGRLKTGTPPRIDGRTIDGFDKLQEIIATSGGETMTFELLRNGQAVSLQVTPRMVVRENILGDKMPTPTVGLVSSPNAPIVTQHYNPLQALGAACGRTWDIVRLSLKGIGQIITGRASLDQLQGPVGIAQITKKVADFGILPFLNLLAVLSVSIGLINLFPIPLLDGGHLLYYACEAVLGRPLGERIQDVGFRLGLVVVLGLMLLATWNDIARLDLF